MRLLVNRRAVFVKFHENWRKEGRAFLMDVSEIIYACTVKAYDILNVKNPW
jgi:hypothetical protein